MGGLLAVEAGSADEEGVVGAAEFLVFQQGGVEVGVETGEFGVEFGETRGPVGVFIALLLLQNAVERNWPRADKRLVKQIFHVAVGKIIFAMTFIHF